MRLWNHACPRVFEWTIFYFDHEGLFFIMTSPQLPINDSALTVNDLVSMHSKPDIVILLFFLVSTWSHHFYDI